jgi:hypothetical protein
VVDACDLDNDLLVRLEHGFDVAHPGNAPAAKSACSSRG